MASNFDCIGLGVGNEAELEDLIVRLAGAARERLVSDAGEYAIWRSRTGAELWMHLGPAGEDGGEREIIGVTPFFEGRSEVQLNIDRVIKRPDDNSHEGVFQGWVCKGVDDPGDTCPVIFDGVGFAAHSTRVLPAQCHVRLAGFARGVVVLRDEDVEARPEAGASMGTFAQSVPMTSARLTGRVAEWQIFVNEVTGANYHWMVVESGIGALDIVSASETVDSDLAAGVHVQVDCVLFGRTID